ncbi:hypothetical protein MSAS_36250 [Mycobacterium saskatchewanense]|uniref:Lipoprotein LpqN n=1 Tax=Mycobacterium saskatchewanense TaxID=220927 RepID=A0AAJ3NTK8_9MYCO|nr:hypothetical protein [Mycobacterium saskatchewanense]ORW73791.1 hypothetical protein AWC23_00250 [Mycobacterium saskatchewanense]BBX64451.1 hypothetical protein MSAS_36250 [Mycobacterium saskatchewanense]
MVARISVAAVAALVAGATVAGCGGNKASAPSSSPSTTSAASGSITSPSPGQPMDYSSLLIKASDVGGDFTAPQPPVLNPNNAAGVAQLFASADNSRRIGDTILIVADPAAAAAGVDNTKTNYGSKVGGTWQPVDVGSNGTMISGTSPDNSQAIAVLLFTEGKALVNLEFDSTPNDPIDPAVATDIGRKQDAAIKSNLPG